MEKTQDLLLETNEVTVVELADRPHSKQLSLTEVVSMLRSPDSNKTLSFEDGTHDLTDGTNRYPVRGSVQILLPAKLQKYFATRLDVPVEPAIGDSFLQYFLLSSIKQSGEINAAPDDTHYQRHLYRINDLLKGAKGTILDVGCDDPTIGASLCPEGTNYIGLDPFCIRNDPFRLIGVGEYLPFADNSLDGILFNTSLDHILDWRKAINEAYRTLVSGGKMYISTLAWTHNADLIYDSVHFHHFREYELFGAMESFNITEVKRYDYKSNDHRYGLYFIAQKE